MNWLGCGSLRSVQTPNDEEKEKCKPSLGLFKVLKHIFKNTIIAISQSGKEQSGNTKEWMVHLRIKANKSSYREKDKTLEEQFSEQVL